MAIEDAIAQAEAMRAQLAKGGAPAPAPSGTVPPGAAIPDFTEGRAAELDPVAQAELIRQRGEAGTLPTAAAVMGQAEPPAQDPQSRLGRMFGLDNAVGNILRYFGPWLGTPETYNPVDSAVHGLTLGGGDIARGYQRDVITGSPWGTGAGEVKEARDRFAAQHPTENIAGNLIGGVAMPLGPLAKIGTELASPAARLAVASGVGAGVGAGSGAITGALDEFTTGREKMLDAALRGGLFGGALGAAAPLATSLGLGGYRIARNYLGRQWPESQMSGAGTILRDRSSDPNALAGVGERTLDPNAPPADVPTYEPSTSWTAGPRQPNAAEQLRQRIAADQQRVDPNAGVLVPGGTAARPTIGQLAPDDAGVQRLQTDLIAGIMKKPRESWTPAETELVEKAARQGEARTAALQGLADPTADPGSVRVTLQQRLDDLAATHETNLAAAQQEVDRTLGAVGTPMAREARGAALRDQMEAAKAADKAATGRLWDAIDPDGTLRIDQTSVGQAARDIRQQTPAAARPPEGEEKAIFDIAGMGGTAVPFSETQALRSRLLTAIREERATNGETPALRRLQQLRQAVDNSISGTAERAAANDPQVASRLSDGTLPTAGVAGVDRPLPAGDAGQVPQQGRPAVGAGVLRDEVAGGGRPADAAVVPEVPGGAAAPVTPNEQVASDWRAYNEVRGGSNFDAAAAERYRTAATATRQGAETFKNQFTGNLLTTRGAAGDYRVPDTGVGAKILANNESAQAFLAAGGNEAALRGALTDDLHRFIGGQPVTEARLQQWRNTREGALRAAPGFDGEVASVGQAQTRLDAMTRAQVAERRAFQSSEVGAILGGDPGKQIGGILAGRDATPQMMRVRGLVAGNDAAEAGLARAAVDHILNKTVNAQNGQLNPQLFRRLINEKGAAIEVAVGAEGMRTLRAIADDLARPMPGAPQMAGANKGGTPSSFATVFRAMVEGGRPDTTSRLAATVAAGSGKGPLSTAAAIATAGLSKLAASMHARGIEGTNAMLAQAVVDPAFARAILMRASPPNIPLAERAMQAALTAPRTVPAASFDYGAAQKGQRERARRELLAPAR